jgi:rhodanese-related sulfurtransferase
MRLFFIFITLLLLSCSNNGIDSSSGKNYKVIPLSPSNAYELIQSNASNTDFFILDVRTLTEYTNGYIENATNIDYYLPDFSDRVLLLNKNSRYLVYCGSGSRSGHAVNFMLSNAFKDIYDLTGGLSAWKSCGLPVKK